MTIKNFVLGIGIVIVFALVLWQGVETFYPFPEYTDFCPQYKVQEYVNNSIRCEELGGKWDFNAGLVKEGIEGYCDLEYQCRLDFEDAKKSHSKYVFIISIIVAVITFLTGYFVLVPEPVGSALIGSSIWAIFWGSVINWMNFGEYWRFILLFLALIFLIWFTIRLNKKH
jgi:hypothetical protein